MSSRPVILTFTRMTLSTRAMVRDTTYSKNTLTFLLIMLHAVSAPPEPQEYALITKVKAIIMIRIFFIVSFMCNNKFSRVYICDYYIILRHLVAFEFSGFYAEVISADVRVRHIGSHSDDVFVGMEQQVIV